MRELALITFSFVDNKSQIPEQLASELFTIDYVGSINAASHMIKVSAPVLGDDQPSSVVYVPRAEMTVVRIEACNPDGILGTCSPEELHSIVKKNLINLTKAGMTILDRENDNNTALNEKSKLLGGFGVEQTSRVQFYAVFQLHNLSTEGIHGELEGVLSTELLDLAFDESVLP